MILVTGATGLLGSRLLFDLVSDENHVRVLVRNDQPATLFAAYCSANPALKQYIQFVKGDLLDIDSLESALAGVDQVYNCAGLISFFPRDRVKMEQINIGGTANLVNAALNTSSLKHFVHVSSVAALGRAVDGELLNEESHWIPGVHNSNYAISKYGGEREVWRGIAEGLPAAIVNPSVILGPGDRDGGSGTLFQRIYSGFPFYSEGVSGFVDAADVSKAMRFLAEKNTIGERYILNADNLSYGTLFKWMAEAMHVKSPHIKVQPWMGALAWRAEWLRSNITGKAPFITKETTHSALSHYRYSATKIEKTGFQFRPIQETISNTITFLEQHQLLTAF